MQPATGLRPVSLTKLPKPSVLTVKSKSTPLLKWWVTGLSSIAQAHNIWDPHFTIMKTNPYSHTIMTTILITYSGIYNQVYTSGFNTINQIYKITIIHTCLAVISIPLAKIHIKTHSELLHKLYINKSQIYPALSTFCLVPISSVNIRFNLTLVRLLQQDLSYPSS